MGLSLRKKALFLAIACMPLSVVLADGDGVTSENVVPFAYGDMDNWIVREIHESGIIGEIRNGFMSWGPRIRLSVIRRFVIWAVLRGLLPT